MSRDLETASAVARRWREQYGESPFLEELIAEALAAEREACCGIIRGECPVCRGTGDDPGVYCPQCGLAVEAIRKLGGA